jgi:hypothetical protein
MASCTLNARSHFFLTVSYEITLVLYLCFLYISTRETLQGERYMRNYLLFFTLLIFTIGTSAQAATTTSTTYYPKKNTKFGATVEMGSEVVRNKDYTIEGSSTYFLIEPDYAINKNNKFEVGAVYKVRQANGDLKDSEDKNRDHLEDLYLKHTYKAAKFKNNGIADLRLQLRAYSGQDDFFKRRYGANGNYQLRAYFGKPIAGKWYLSKYTSYLRYKSYFVDKDYIGDRTRQYELRARVAPTYRTAKGIELGITATYNHIFKVRHLNDEESIDLDLSARYHKDNNAALFIIGSNYMGNAAGEGLLKRNDDALKDIGYTLILSHYL